MSAVAADGSGLSSAVARLLRAHPHELATLAPELVDQLGSERLEEVLELVRRRVGEVRSVSGGGDALTVHGSRGRASAWAACDQDGLLTGLLLRPQSRVEPWLPGLASTWAYVVLVAWPVLLGQLAFSAWRAHTVTGWLTATLTAQWLLLLRRGLGWLAPWVLTRATRNAVVLLASVPLAAAVRLPRLRRDGWTGRLTLDVAVLVLVAAACAWSRRPDPATPISHPLCSPFLTGTWCVVQGGPSRLVNHHVPADAQRRALDLVRLSATGARARGLFPADLHRYGSYGEPLVAPCCGTVVTVVDALDDQPPQQTRLAPPYGNQVRIDTGHEIVVLAHLRPGSVPVKVGQRLRQGDPIGQVGNSGNTTEPHLHLHAERDGMGLALQFDGLRRAPRRGDRLHSEPSRPHTSRT